MPTFATNAGRDHVEVHNRLDRVVLAIDEEKGSTVETTLSPDDARAIARALEDAAETGERTEPS